MISSVTLKWFVATPGQQVSEYIMTFLRRVLNNQFRVRFSSSQVFTVLNSHPNTLQTIFNI